MFNVKLDRLAYSFRKKVFKNKHASVVAKDTHIHLLIELNYNIIVVMTLTIEINEC